MHKQIKMTFCTQKVGLVQSASNVFILLFISLKISYLITEGCHYLQLSKIFMWWRPQKASFRFVTFTLWCDIIVSFTSLQAINPRETLHFGTIKKKIAKNDFQKNIVGRFEPNNEVKVSRSPALPCSLRIVYSDLRSLYCWRCLVLTAKNVLLNTLNWNFSQ